MKSLLIWLYGEIPKSSHGRYYISFDEWRKILYTYNKYTIIGKKIEKKNATHWFEQRSMNRQPSKPTNLKQLELHIHFTIILVTLYEGFILKTFQLYTIEIDTFFISSNTPSPFKVSYYPAFVGVKIKSNLH